MTRGQAEGTFTWIFVLLAGGAILILFFSLVRSCSESNDTARDAAGAASAASAISERVFQPEGMIEITVVPLTVMCVEGTTYLVGENARVSLGQTAVFLSQSLDGTVHVRNVPLELQIENVPEIPLGSAVYGLDDDVYYVQIVGSSAAYPAFDALFGELPTVKRLSVNDLADTDTIASLIPRSAVAAIFIGDPGELAALDVSSLPATTDVRGVHVGSARTTFFSGRPLAEIGRADAEHETLSIGAIITGNPGLYRCGRAGLERRAHLLTTLYENRSTLLGASLSDACSTMHLQIADRLSEINNGDAYLSQLFANERYLSGMQNGLMQRSCPVIA